MKMFTPGMSKKISLQLQLFCTSLYMILSEAKRETGHIPIAIILHKMLRDISMGHGFIIQP